MEYEWFCPICGSTNIEYKAWVNLNNGDVGMPVYTEGDDDRCAKCGKHIKALFLGDFIEDEQEE